MADEDLFYEKFAHHIVMEMLVLGRIPRKLVFGSCSTACLLLFLSILTLCRQIVEKYLELLTSTKKVIPMEDATAMCEALAKAEKTIVKQNLTQASSVSS